MAVNRASNSRFIVRDSRTGMVARTTRPDSRRLSGISNFTATLQSCPVLVSRFHRATSTIIERIRDGGYDLWKIASAFLDVIWLREEGLGAGYALRELADLVVGVFLK